MQPRPLPLPAQYMTSSNACHNLECSTTAYWSIVLYVPVQGAILSAHLNGLGEKICQAEGKVGKSRSARRHTVVSAAINARSQASTCMPIFQIPQLAMILAPDGNENVPREAFPSWLFAWCRLLWWIFTSWYSPSSVGFACTPVGKRHGHGVRGGLVVALGLCAL